MVFGFRLSKARLAGDGLCPRRDFGTQDRRPARSVKSEPRVVSASIVTFWLFRADPTRSWACANAVRDSARLSTWCRGSTCRRCRPAPAVDGANGRPLGRPYHLYVALQPWPSPAVLYSNTVDDFRKTLIAAEPDEAIHGGG